VRGIGQSATAETFPGSTEMESRDMIWPRNGTDDLYNLHFEGLTFRLDWRNQLKQSRKLSVVELNVEPKIMISSR
jgi:hypothetical protein